MNEKELDLVVSRLIKVGRVTAIDGNRVRVYFEDTDMTSALLPVLHGFYKANDEPVEPAMPEINDIVAVLYLPFPDSDGFVIGGLLT